MRVLALLALVAMLSGGPERPSGAAASVATPPRYAQLGNSVAGLFLKLVNERLQGRIDPRLVSFEAPAGVLLEDIVLSAPDGGPVARIKRARVSVSLAALLSGEIAISRLEIEGPQLILEMNKGKLNLLEALTPRKKPDPTKPAEGTFRIDSVVLSGGGFRFTDNDNDNVTLAFDDISAEARLDVDLGREIVLLDVNDVKILSGNVRLKELDVPLRNISARQVKLVSDKLQLIDVEATGLGGLSGQGPTVHLKANGRIATTGSGLLALHGHVDADAGAWPDRLTPLPFVTPILSADIDVAGPFADPTITAVGPFGKADLYGYALDSGIVKVVIDQSRVLIKEGTTAKVGRGSLRVHGEVRFPAEKATSTKIDVRVRVDAVSLAAVLGPAQLDTTLKGVLSADARVTGRAGADTEVVIAADLSGRNLELYDLYLPTEVEGDLRVLVAPGRVTLQKAVIVDVHGGLALSVAGDIDLKNESISLSVDVEADDLPKIVIDIPADIVVPLARFAASIKGPFKNVVVEGDASVPSGRAYGVPIEALSAHVRVAGKEIRIDRGVGIAAGGKLTQTAPLLLTTGKRGAFSSGTFLLDNADVDRITAPDGAKLPLVGIVDLEAVMRGPLANPRVLLRASGAGLVIAGEKVGNLTTALVATKDALSFDTVTVTSSLLRARAQGLRLDTKTLRLTGVVDVDALDLSAIENGKAAQLQGSARGVVAIDGDVRAPSLKADLIVKQLSAQGFTFGSGRLSIGVYPDVGGGSQALTLTAAGVLAWDFGRYDVRAAYALGRNTVNAELKVADVDLAHLGPLLPQVGFAGMHGLVNGQLTASGPLDHLDAVLKVRIPDFVVEVPPTSNGPQSMPNGPQSMSNGPQLRPFGPVFADVRLDDGGLSGRVCAFPDPAARGGGAATGSPCENPQRLWASLKGAVRPLAGTFDLSVDASADLERIEELFPALQARALGLSTWARVSTRLQRPSATAATTATVAARIHDLILRPPGAPVLRIARPFSLDYVKGRAVIGTEAAHFITSRNDFDLVIAAGSSVGADDIDVAIDGDVALSVLKVLTNEIANAAGTAATHLKVSGRFDDGLRIEGTVRPQVGARLTLRSLGQALVFEDGQIEVSPDALDNKRLVVAFEAPCASRKNATCPLRAALGEGKVQVSGSFVARTNRTEEQTWLQRFDVGLAGTSLEIINRLGRADTSFELRLKGDAPAPELSGRIEMSDGLFKKDFQIRNFVLSEAPSRPSTPLWQTLTPMGLGGLTFNVAASMQNVRVKARINAFSIDASLRGELKLQRSLKLPAIDGAVEVEEGTVDFPRARFDVLEMQVQFPTSAEGGIDPLVHVAARTELPAGAAGNDVEVPVDLSLDGSFDLMQLDLIATDPNRQWSRTELFAYILFGTVPAQDGGLVSAGVDVARQAALRELAAPVSEELTLLAERQLGLNVNIDVVSGWELQLGQRLVIEGQGFLTQTTQPSDSATSATSGGTDALRVRLLFFDHLPLGKSLSLEGRLGVTSDVRLSFRLFEE